MNIIFKTNKQKRKQCLKRIYINNKTWKREIQKIYLSATTGIIITISTILTNITTTVTIATILIDIFTVCAVISIGLLCIDTAITAKYKCARPYSLRTNETLIITNNHLIYKFWKDIPNNFLIQKQETTIKNEDAFVYTIKKSDIKNLIMDEYNICRITGNGILVQPIWATNSQTNNIINRKDFSFIVAFDSDNAIEIIKKCTKSFVH